MTDNRAAPADFAPHSLWEGGRGGGLRRCRRARAAGKLDPSAFITHHYGIDDIGKAFEAANDKLLLVPGL